MKLILNDFFNKSFESEINKSLQELSYEFSEIEILHYLRSIISIDITEFLTWIDLNSFITIDSSDMPQLSDYNDAFYNVVYKLREAGDKGFRYIEIGQMLQNDGVVRNDMANRKYGENHAKAAEYLGFLYSLHYHYYVSCIGYVIDKLSPDELKKLYVRLFIRTNLFKAIYIFSKSGVLNFRLLFDMLSDKTYKRRLSSTKYMINSLNLSNEYDFSMILKNIIY